LRPWWLEAAQIADSLTVGGLTKDHPTAMATADPRSCDIAEKTAEVHARNVREKLGLESRAQIAAWAAQHGL
jgi:hypothetical protein